GSVEEKNAAAKRAGLVGCELAPLLEPRRVLGLEPPEALADLVRRRPRARRLLLEREQVRDPHRVEDVELLPQLEVGVVQRCRLDDVERETPEGEQERADLAVRRAAELALGVVEQQVLGEGVL